MNKLSVAVFSFIILFALNVFSCAETNCKKYVKEFPSETYFASYQEERNLSFEAFTAEDKKNCLCPKNGPLCDDYVENCGSCEFIPAHFETYIFFFKNKYGAIIRPDLILLHFFDRNCREISINLNNYESRESIPSPRGGPFEFKVQWKNNIMYGKTILYYDKISGSDHSKYCKMVPQDIQVIFPIE